MNGYDRACAAIRVRYRSEARTARAIAAYRASIWRLYFALRCPCC
jgi:hypothetical protein